MPPSGFQPRQAQSGQKAEGCGQQRGQAGDEQAVFEEEPVHRKKISLSFAVVDSNSRKSASQFNCKVGVETPVEETPSRALTATRCAITSRRWRNSKRRW